MNTSRSRISVFYFWHLCERFELKEWWLLPLKKVPASELFIQTHNDNISANTCCGFLGKGGILRLYFCQHWKSEITHRGHLKMWAAPRTLLHVQVPPRLAETCCYQRVSVKASFSILQMSGHKYETCLMVSWRPCCVSSSVRLCLDW